MFTPNVPNDPRIFNRQQADGTYRPLSEFFDRRTDADGDAAELARLRDQVKMLVDALENAIHEIKMETWAKFNGQGEFENVAEKSPVIISARAALAAYKESK